MSSFVEDCPGFCLLEKALVTPSSKVGIAHLTGYYVPKNLTSDL